MQNTCSVETPCKVVKWGGSQTSYIVLSVWWMDSGCYHYKRMARQKTRANIWGGYHKRNIIMFHVYYLTRKFKINSILKLDLNFPLKKKQRQQLQQRTLNQAKHYALCSLFEPKQKKWTRSQFLTCFYPLQF